MLATPYSLALGLDAKPTHYAFDEPPRLVVERLYASLNDAGDALSAEKRADVVAEALAAFGHNVDVHTEEPVGGAALAGTANLVAGALRRAFSR